MSELYNNISEQQMDNPDSFFIVWNGVIYNIVLSPGHQVAVERFTGVCGGSE